MQEYKEYSGKEFNEIKKGETFYKFFPETENHFGFKFKTGSNIDTKKFDVETACSNGLFFTDLENAPNWYTSRPHYRIVTIPDDARVSFESNKYKADRIVLSEKLTYNQSNELTQVLAFCLSTHPPFHPEYIDNMPEDLKLKMLMRYPEAICKLKEQTPEICLATVKQNGAALQYVKEQTPKICLAAVQQCGVSLKHVIVQTPEICLAAVKQNGSALRYVKEQTPEICLAAVKQNGFTLQYVKEQTDEICLAAVIQYIHAKHYVKRYTPEICAFLISRGKKIDYNKLFIIRSEDVHVYRLERKDDDKMQITMA